MQNFASSYFLYCICLLIAMDSTCREQCFEAAHGSAKMLKLHLCSVAMPRCKSLRLSGAFSAQQQPRVDVSGHTDRRRGRPAVQSESIFTTARSDSTRPLSRSTPPCVSATVGVGCFLRLRWPKNTNRQRGDWA